MTLDKARERLQVQVDFGGAYNRHATQLILAEVAREHGQQAVDQLIRELRLDQVFDFKIGQTFI